YFFISIAYSFCLYFFHVTAPPAISTLSLHDALPISLSPSGVERPFISTPSRRRISEEMRILYIFPSSGRRILRTGPGRAMAAQRDRKSTRLNSSHVSISYAVFCLKKKKKQTTTITQQ